MSNFHPVEVVGRRKFKLPYLAVWGLTFALLNTFTYDFKHVLHKKTENNQIVCDICSVHKTQFEIFLC